MSKAAKIAITIGLMVVWAILRSLLEYSDFPLPVLTFVLVLIILGLWAFLKTPDSSEEGKAQTRDDSVNTSVAGKPIYPYVNRTVPTSLSKQLTPEILSEEKKSVGTPVAEIAIKPSITKDTPYEQQLLELLRKACFPRIFMDPYDPDKVSIANDLYQKLQASNLSSQDIYSLRDRAVKELGIMIDASFLFDELSAVCNPIKYMDPYDAERVEIANGLYRRVLENKNDLETLERIREEAVNKGLFDLAKQSDLFETANNDALSTEEQPSTSYVVVNYWKSLHGNLIRLVKYETSDLFYLEKENNDSWELFALLKIIKGHIQNGGSGAEFVKIDSPHVKYKIHRFVQSLTEITQGEISNIWEWEGLPNNMYYGRDS